MELQRARLKPNPTTISSHTQRKLLVLLIHYANGSDTFTYRHSEKRMFNNDRKILEKKLIETNLQDEGET